MAMTAPTNVLLYQTGLNCKERSTDRTVVRQVGRIHNATSHHSRFADDYLNELRESYAPPAFDLQSLTCSRYLLANEGKYSVYYAPLGAWPTHDARLIFVGLTPGFAQMQIAARTFTDATDVERGDGDLYASLLRSRVAFAGRMRENLCDMLDGIGMPDAVGVRTSSELFSLARTDVATTSALMFPVFVGSALRNFSGGGIDLGQVNMFRVMLDDLLAPRLAYAPNALIVPLGTAASSGVRFLCEKRNIDRNRVLADMPHPSGSNGHRVRLFRANRDAMHDFVVKFFRR